MSFPDFESLSGTFKVSVDSNILSNSSNVEYPQPDDNTASNTNKNIAISDTPIPASADQFVSLRYSFRPDLLDNSRDIRMAKDTESPSSYIFEDSSTNHLKFNRFQDSLQPNQKQDEPLSDQTNENTLNRVCIGTPSSPQDNECVLLFDPSTNSFSLHALTAVVRLSMVRKKTQVLENVGKFAAQASADYTTFKHLPIPTHPVKVLKQKPPKQKVPPKTSPVSSNASLHVPDIDIHDNTHTPPLPKSLPSQLSETSITTSVPKKKRGPKPKGEQVLPKKRIPKPANTDLDGDLEMPDAEDGEPLKKKGRPKGRKKKDTDDNSQTLGLQLPPTLPTNTNNEDQNLNIENNLDSDQGLEELANQLFDSLEEDISGDEDEKESNKKTPNTPQVNVSNDNNNVNELSDSDFEDDSIVSPTKNNLTDYPVSSNISTVNPQTSSATNNPEPTDATQSASYGDFSFSSDDDLPNAVTIVESSTSKPAKNSALSAAFPSKAATGVGSGPMSLTAYLGNREEEDMLSSSDED